MQFTKHTMSILSCCCRQSTVYRVGAFCLFLSFDIFPSPYFQPRLVNFPLFLLLLLIFFKLGQCMRRDRFTCCFSFICIFRVGRCCCRTSFLTLFLSSFPSAIAAWLLIFDNLNVLLFRDQIWCMCVCCRVSVYVFLLCVCACVMVANDNLIDER